MNTDLNDNLDDFAFHQQRQAHEKRMAEGTPCSGVFTDAGYIDALHARQEQAETSYRASQNRRQRLLFLLLLPCLALALYGSWRACKSIWHGGEPAKAPPAPAAEQHEAARELQPGVPVKEGQSIRFIF